MRTAALGVLLIVVLVGGCKPPVEVDEGATVPIAAVAEEPLPPVPQDKGNLAWLARERESNNPLHRDLANGRFRGGKLEELLAAYSPDLVLMHNGYSTAVYANGNPRYSLDRLFVSARNGKLVYAHGAGCTWSPVFFDGLTDDERQVWGASCWDAFCKHFGILNPPAAPPAQADDAIPAPREVGKPNP